jgi:hypothetical protein
MKNFLYSAKWTLALSSLLSTGVAFAQSVDVDEIISDQRTRQISRQVSDNIARRISGDIDDSFKNSALRTSSLNGNNPLGASADGNTLLNDASLWNAFSWSRISDDGGSLGSDFDVDVFQNTAGIDKKLGDFYFGGSLTYAYSNTNLGFPGAVGDFENHTHSVSITPYAAYVFNKNFFISALSGYTYTNANPQSPFGSAPESETDSYNSELTINGLKVIDNWFMKGKIGARYIHGHTKPDSTVTLIPGVGSFGTPQQRDNTDSWTYLVDGEGGYSFANGIRLYTGVLFEYNNPKPNQGFADGVFYYNAGIDYAVTKDFTMGAKATTDLNNEDIDLTTIALSARLAL